LSVEDVLAIQRVVADYADAVCRRDEHAWAATWAADCRWELTGGRAAVGREATVTLWRDAIAAYPWVSQVVTGCLVEVDDESASTASAGTYILELNRLLDGSGALHLGHYADKFAKIDGRWLFTERVLHMLYRGPLNPGTVHPLPLG
jgi:SnoaL-like domain